MAVETAEGTVVAVWGHIMMAYWHTVLTLDTAGAVVMALDMVADCKAVMLYTVVVELHSVVI